MDSNGRWPATSFEGWHGTVHGGDDFLAASGDNGGVAGLRLGAAMPKEEAALTRDSRDDGARWL
uniref:DUF834 domain-containing protein n=1 Tax=Oryza nivara TaxID=4536 RepID=A0A0E0GPJ6_ORYNI